MGINMAEPEIVIYIGLLNDKNVDIKFSAHDTFLESPSRSKLKGYKLFMGTKMHM